MKTIHQKIKDLGISFSGHYSDLYIPVNEQTKKLLEEYEYRESVTIFTSQIDEKLWYDIPFANDDYRKFKSI